MKISNATTYYDALSSEDKANIIKSENGMKLIYNFRRMMKKKLKKLEKSKAGNLMIKDLPDYNILQNPIYTNKFEFRDIDL